MSRNSAKTYLAIGVAILLFAAARQSSAAEKWEYGEVEFDTRLAGQAMVRWVTASGAVAGVGWQNLADKLNAPKLDTENMSNNQRVFAQSVHRLRLLSQIGSEGWELVSQSRNETSTVHTWTFKRKSQ
jgi:hypothetical protein